MTILNKDAILGASDINYEEVDVPEWGGTVRLRSLSAADRYSIQDEARDPDGKVNGERFVFVLLAASIVGEDGSRLFANDEFRLLAEKSYPVIERISQVAFKMNGLGQEQKEIEKN